MLDDQQRLHNSNPSVLVVDFTPPQLEVRKVSKHPDGQNDPVDVSERFAAALQ